MGSTDLRIDHYIARSADFAQPILAHIRGMVHACCPEVVETMKWSFPHFDYKGSILCSMASFKSHCAFGFWLGPVMQDTHGLFVTSGEGKAMGQWGQIKSLKDLPGDEILASYILQAVQLTDAGIKLPKKAPGEKKDLVIPQDLLSSLQKNKKALAHFESMSYSHQKEYAEWIAEAKTEATRQRRADTAAEWIAEGKGRNWKYSK